MRVRDTRWPDFAGFKIRIHFPPHCVSLNFRVGLAWTVVILWAGDEMIFRQNFGRLTTSE